MVEKNPPPIVFFSWTALSTHNMSIIFCLLNISVPSLSQAKMVANRVAAKKSAGVLNGSSSITTEQPVPANEGTPMC